MMTSSICSRTAGMALTAFLSISISNALAREDYAGHSHVRIQVATEKQADWLIHSDLDIWNHGVGIGSIDARVTPEQKATLIEMGYDVDVVVEDLGPLVAAEFARLNVVKRGGGFDYEDFYPYETIVAHMEQMAVDYPEFVELIDFGLTIEGRSTWGIKVTSPDGPADKPALLFHSTQHAREWLTTPVPLFAAEHLLNNYGTDPQATDFLDRVEWYFIPVMNPDGYVYSWDEERYWRKNRRDNEGPTFGVDLNRNWEKEWGGPGSSGDPGSETYRGTAPLSEPETQNIYNFIIEHPNLQAYIDIHSFGEYVMWPWAYTASPCPDHDAFNDIGQAMKDAIADVHGHQYTAGSVGDALYLAAGGSVDTVYDVLDPFIYAYTIEVRGFDFVVPPSEIIPNAEENLQAILTLAELTTSPFDIQLPNGAPTLLSPDAPTTFDVVIELIADTVIPGSEQLWYRTDPADPFVSVDLVETGDLTYEATLPAMGCTALPEFYVSADGMSGITITEPEGAPETVFSALVGEQVIGHSDNFETDTGWTVSGDAEAGHWERGLPAGDGTKGDPVEDFDGSGQCYLTENVPGNSDVDNGSTTLTSPVYDLTTLADPYVSYARWYFNDAGSDANNEVFVVELSENGGTWVPMDIVGPDGDEVVGGWIHKEFRIADFVTPGSTFQIRFTAADSLPNTHVEAAIDAVAIYDVLCESASCEGDSNGDNVVDPLDSGYVLARFGCDVGTGDADCDAADQNGDGVVDPLDVGFVLARFGECS